MRFVVDTNVPVYAAHRDRSEHASARSAHERWLAGNVPWAVTWGIVYGFLGIVTHPSMFRQPLSVEEAPSFRNPVLASDVVTLACATAGAHEATGQTAGFLAGLAHPISGLDHVLAMVAVGLWGAVLGARAIWVLPVA